MVAEELTVPPSAICMVAAHVWDTIGAQHWLLGRLIARPVMLLCLCMGYPSRRLSPWICQESPADVGSGADQLRAALTVERRGCAIELAASKGLFLGRCAIVSMPGEPPSDSSTPFM
jgi:hypothetical protein